MHFMMILNSHLVLANGSIYNTMQILTPEKDNGLRGLEHISSLQHRYVVDGTGLEPLRLAKDVLLVTRKDCKARDAPVPFPIHRILSVLTANDELDIHKTMRMTLPVSNNVSLVD